MKELTIEQKAKAYDKAIERAVNIRTGKCETTFIFTEGLFDYLFPELEECNEEEVRKAMIDFFKHEREEGVVVSHYGVNIERMIAWLEKQGQVNETIISQHENKTCKENNYSLTSEDERIRKELINYLITDEDNGVPKVGQIPIDNVIAWLEKQNPIMAKSPQLGGQRSSWSKEDKEMLREALVLIETVEDKNKVKDCFLGVKTWLKSLKGRIGG